MKTRISTVLLSTLVCGAALADDVAIFPVNGTNIAADEADAIGALFAQAYAQASGLRVLSPAATRSIVESAKDAQSAASALSVAEYIVIDAIRLTAKIKLSAACYDAAGVLLHRAEMISLDDIDTVTDRLAVALYHKHSPRETRSIETITEVEQKKPNRLLSEKVFGFKLQFSVILAPGARFDPTLSGFFDMRFEAESYFLELGIGVMVPTNTWQSTDQRIRHYFGFVTELGASYYFINGDISIYAGGGLLPRLIGDGGTDFGVRLAAYAQSGIIFFRHSSTRLYADFRAAQNLLPFQSYSVTSGQSRQFFPTELTLSFGIGW